MTETRAKYGATGDEAQLSRIMSTFDFDRCVVPGWWELGGSAAKVDLMGQGPAVLQEALELDAETACRHVMAGEREHVEGGFRAERLVDGVIRLAFEVASSVGVEP